jgi:transglutaminase-like putative cysteine protease
MIPRVWRYLLTADAMGILLFVLSLQVLAYGVSASVRNTDTGNFFWICLLSASISYRLGKSRWNGIQASVGTAALGVLFIWILGARLTQPLLDLGEAALSILPQIIPSIRNRAPIDATSIIETWTVIAQTSNALLTRLYTWIYGFDKGITINDLLIQNMVWVLILWLCSAWMGWFAEKRNAMASLLPAIFLLAAITSYSEYKIDSLWIMVLLLLLLMGIWNYKIHKLHWEKRRIDYSDSVRVDNAQAVILLTLAVGAASIMTPSFSWQDIFDYLRESRSSKTAEMLGIQEPRATGQPSGAQNPSMPRDHLLTGGDANSEEIVMTIKTGEFPPIADQILTIDVPHYYWRSTIYDQYASTGWVTSSVSSQKISAHTPLIPGLLNGYRIVQLDVQMTMPQGRLYWSGILFSTDIPFTARWRIRPPSDLFAEQSTLLQADMFAASSNDVVYQADVYIPMPTITELRAASTDYPEEISAHYLTLPRALPERVHELAREITDGRSNPYDKSKAIESYLRTNYPYDLDIPAPPEGRDAADYFLFDLQKGYCDYYATAMVVLARSAGIPSRFVSGYSPGSYDAPNAQYVVRELNAHSWVEIYFPEIGWVEFEPTAALPEIERTQQIIPIPENQTNEESASQLLTRFRLEKILLWVSPVAGIFVMVFLYFVLIERWLYLRLAPEAAIERIYQKFYLAGRPLAGEWTRAETSSEYLHKLVNNLNGIGGQFPFMKLLDKLKNNAVSLTEIYQLTLFAYYHVDKMEANAAWHTWTRLRRQLVFARLLLFVGGNKIVLKRVTDS